MCLTQKYSVHISNIKRQVFVYFVNNNVCLWKFRSELSLFGVGVYRLQKLFNFFPFVFQSFCRLMTLSNDALLVVQILIILSFSSETISLI